jgi:cytochrome c-type biogenesis protein
MLSNNTPAIQSKRNKSRNLLFFHSLAFVLGFSLIFVIGWGGAATILGQLFVAYKLWIARIGGVILIIFGLATMELIHIPWFYMDTRQSYRGNTSTLWGSLAMGVFFAAGWSPCIGATLGAILTLGFSSSSIGQALYLSLGYSLGLGLPFLLLALLVDQAIPLVKRLRKYLRLFQIVSGLLIIAIGTLMVTTQITAIARWAQQSGLYLDFQSQGQIPSLITAVIAGALSFLSPCVLPLVPAYLGYLSGHAIAVTKTELADD